MHVIAVIAMHGVLPFDLSMPCEVFGRTYTDGIDQPYQVRVCGEARDIKAGAFDLRVEHDLSHVAGAHTVIVPGIANPAAPIPTTVVSTLHAAAAGGARIASICTGAFVLAATGLLDGLRATTHWLAAPALAARYPAIDVDPNVLFVDNGQILTSAGAAAGLDMCLHMVRRDYGAAAAAHAARLAVMPLERDGGQAQFIVHEAPSSAASLEPLLRWMQQNLGRALTLQDIARQATMSTRTLSRRFREQTGTTPSQWMAMARVRRAQHLLEASALSVEQIATEVGFVSAATLRDRFRRVVGVTPTAYRHASGGRVEAAKAAGCIQHEAARS
ncbi:GlxA family transcriptional regulator [Vineibacter terrae]|uniref:GlxA family transcriptional regulator n=1 Tax=Vineibacter terrae TaxID=2586908 RepID=UPI002E36F7C3|nr:helix-turn-helix domain-containing protein [Vineibacter terrae]HEX2885782.1 helix-turn-helix domain-containing protein [Vineibacter terrae]